MWGHESKYTHNTKVQIHSNFQNPNIKFLQRDALALLWGPEQGDRLVVRPGESAPCTELVSRCPQPSPQRPRRPHAGLLNAKSKVGSKSWGTKTLTGAWEMPMEKGCWSRKMRGGAQNLDDHKLNWKPPGRLLMLPWRVHWQAGVKVTLTASNPDTRFLCHPDTPLLPQPSSISPETSSILNLFNF